MTMLSVTVPFRIRYSLPLVYILFATRLVVAQSVYEVDARYPVHPLDSHLLVVADPSGSLTDEQLLSDSSLSWQPLSTLPFYTDVGTVYHTRLRLRTRDTLSGWRLLAEDHSYNDVAWIRGNGRMVARAYADRSLLWERTSGADVSEEERDLPGHRSHNQVRFTLPPDSTVTLLTSISANSFGVFPRFNITLRAPDYLNFHPPVGGGAYWNIFLVGATTVVFLYQFLLFAFLREPVYGWFSLWLLLSTITQAMTTGFEPVDWLGLSGFHSRFVIQLIVPHAMAFTFWFFGRAFLHARERYPAIDRWILLLVIFGSLHILVSVVYLLGWDPVVYITQFGYNYERLALLSACGLALAVRISLLDDPLARIFGVGAGLGSLCILIGALWSLRLFRVSFDPYAASIWVQIVVYCFGLAYRRSLRVKRERETAVIAERQRGEIDRLEDLDRVKTKFFANVSHEFRTPLSLIRGPLELAKDRADHLREHFDAFQLTRADYRTIRHNTERLEALVDQLLTLAELQNGGQYLKILEGDIVAFVRKSVMAFTSLAEGNNVALGVSLPPARRPCWYDADRLETIVVNLVANAIKFAGAPGRVSVSLAFDGDFTVLEVSDNGPGIPADEIEHIFDRFYRVEGTGEVGSGIGLALTKELVVAYGGTIAVRSLHGQGSTFRTRLPVTQDALPEGSVILPPSLPNPGPSSSPEARPTPTDNSQTAAKQLPTVLVVEDDHDLAAFIRDVLSPFYHLLHAGEGGAAIRIAVDTTPDLILTDIMMPGMDGIAFCHAIRNNSKTSHIPVIMLTAKADQASVNAGLNQGADDYLTKPFDPRELKMRISNQLASRRRLYEHLRSAALTLLPDIDATSLDDRFVEAVTTAIRDRLDDDRLSVADIARKIGYSRSQLTRKLKSVVGKTPSQLIKEMRLHEAHRRLERGSGSVSEIAYAVGYGNLSYFAKSYRKQFGYTPSETRNQKENPSSPVAD
jgi:signal transduction histidine kinase/AraC-like DNA-binding protein